MSATKFRTNKADTALRSELHFYRSRRVPEERSMPDTGRWFNHVCCVRVRVGAGQRSSVTHDVAAEMKTVKRSEIHVQSRLSASAADTVEPFAGSVGAGAWPNVKVVVMPGSKGDTVSSSTSEE